MRLPTATYRIQFRNGFGFAEARALADYLDDLGVDTLYASPIWLARSDSPHGYDVCDPNTIAPELGGEEGLDALTRELASLRMRLLCDLVPNHMAASHENPWWWDVLEHGQESAHAQFFDIDWDRGDGRIHLPVLGAPYREALETGALAIDVEQGRLVARHHEHRFPVRAGTDADVPGRSLEEKVRALGSQRRGGVESIDRVLSRQAYRLTFWRDTDEINYRRFFDITDLVCVRVEDPGVFRETHDLVLRLIAAGVVHGVRIDHIDGLADPEGYLRRLKRSLGDGFVLAEKILERDEDLPRTWPVDGTTGYEYMNAAGGLFVDPAGAEQLAELAARLTGEDRSFDRVAVDKKRFVLNRLFTAEVEALTDQLVRLRRDEAARLIARDRLREALVEVSAHLPCYRTYVRGEEIGAADRRRIMRAVRGARERLGPRSAALTFLARVLRLEAPSSAAKRMQIAFVMRWQQLTGPAAAKGFEDTALYAWVRLASRNEVGGDPAEPAVSPEELHRRNRRRLTRWPGTLNATSTHDTKRSEDVRARIDVLSEIPDVWTEHVGQWWEINSPYRTELATGPAPDPNAELLFYQTLVGAWPYTAREERGFAGRVGRYMVKASREAKTRTSWRDPDPDYERALERFVSRVLSARNAEFRRDLADLVRLVAHHGMLNSLAQIVGKIAAPGVPDLYQGAELWHLRLVDPDNRAPVDYLRRRRMLDSVRRRAADDAGAVARELLTSWTDGGVKLYVTHRALAARRRDAELYLHGSYLPIEPTGRRSQHVFAFARRRRGRWALACIPRLTTRIASPPRFPVGDVWDRIAMPLPPRAPDRWRNVFTGEVVNVRSVDGRPVLRVADTLASFPVALLTNEEGRSG